MRGTRSLGGPRGGGGSYALSEVAKYTGAGKETVRYWFLGRTDRPEPILDGTGLRGGKGSRTGESPLTVSFHDLIDALVVARFREEGVPLQYLRKIHRALVREFERPNPFSWKNFYVEGRRVLVSVLDELGNETLRELLTNQQAFAKILKDYLKQVEFDSESLQAIRWHIFKGVVIDPARRFGKPIVEGCCFPTCILASAYQANHKKKRLVADWYGVSQQDVATAVAFEESLIRAA